MNANPDVDEWLEAYDNPMKEVVAATRDLVLRADQRVGETIKWQAPTFIYKGNIASFNPRAKNYATLMFHKGASIKGKFPNLQGDGKAARSFKVESLDDLSGKARELKAIFRAWCEMQDSA